MTVTAPPPGITAALRRAAVRATLAPSVHNTQPWNFELHDEQLDIFAERARQLHVLDPMRRQLTISCGCALFNARVAVAASGLDPIVERFPDQTRPDLLATVSATSRRSALSDPLATYDSVIERRQTNRRRFNEDDVPAEVIESLEAAAIAEGAGLLVIHTEDQRLALTRLAQHADEVQLLNPAYRAELRAWTSDDPRRPDGVPAMAVPHVDGTAHDDIPIRDFDTSGMGWLPAATRSSSRQCLVLLWTEQDTEPSWLKAGEALERVLLEITRRGYAASPLTQVVEVPSARAALRRELGLVGFPHVLLRIGRAPLTPASRRRRLVDVLVERH
jgi:nitroreductase